MTLAGRPSIPPSSTALTSELLPMPREPQSSALLAGKPPANCRVLSSRMSRTRSIPCSNGRATRLIFGTGTSLSASAKKTKASAAPRSTGGGGGGASRSRASAMRWSRGASGSAGNVIGQLRGARAAARDAAAGPGGSGARTLPYARRGANRAPICRTRPLLFAAKLRTYATLRHAVASRSAQQDRGVRLDVRLVRLCPDIRVRRRFRIAAGQLHADHPDHGRDVFPAVPAAAAADERAEAGPG